MKVSIVLRSPFLDKIPSLKNLIIFLTENNIKVKLITTENPNYPISKITSSNYKQITVKERRREIEVPTSIKMITTLLKDIYFDKSDLYIGGDEQGCNLIINVKKIFSIKYWNFLLEYPEINNDRSIDTLKKADKIITHDKWHSDFLTKNCNISNDKFLYLPNSTFTKGESHKTDFLHKRLELPKDEVILLHSGGLGKWFLCKELAASSKCLKNGQTLVFHGSHNVTTSDYFEEIKEIVEKNNLPVKFSLRPVTDEELDILVASATIGLAFYSLKELGYRAENMGLAAGKIGNYLKCGVPVIATNVHSLKYLEDYKCGIRINNFEEFPKAVETILNNLEEYRNNAFKCYKDLWNPIEYLKIINESIKK